MKSANLDVAAAVPSHAGPVQEGSLAPDFTATDASGAPFTLSSLRGRRVHLSFFRTAGCPTCNLRVHELLRVKDRLAPLTVVGMYVSSAENLGTYARMLGGSFPFRLVSDESRETYRLYGVESSAAKLLSGLFLHGGLARMRQGQSLFQTKVADEGRFTLVGAEFLIDERGIIRTAHRGAHSGDYLPVDELVRFAAG